MSESSELVLSDCPSAARRVHDNDDLRREIASHLWASELARKCVMISKLWLETAAERLYREVNLKRFGELVRKTEENHIFQARPIYSCSVRIIKTPALPERVREMLRVVSRLPNALAISGQGIEVDLMKKRIMLDHEATVDGCNPKAVDIHSMGQWPAEYRIIWRLSLEIQSADRSPADFFTRFLPSLSHNEKLESKIEVDDRGSSQTPRIRLRHLTLYTVDRLQPIWWKEIWRMPHLTRLVLRTAQQVKVSAKDIIRIVRSNDHRLESLMLYPGGRTYDHMYMDAWLRNHPSIAQLPQILQAIADSQHLSTVMLTLSMDLASASAFALRVYRDSSAMCRQITIPPRTVLADVVIRIIYPVDLLIEYDERVTAFRHLVIGEQLLGEFIRRANIFLEFEFMTNIESDIYDELMGEYLKAQEHGKLPEMKA